MGILLKTGTFTPSKLLRNPLVSSSLRNFDFLLLHTDHFDKSIILPFLAFTSFGFLFSVFFQNFQIIR